MRTRFLPLLVVTVWTVALAVVGFWPQDSAQAGFIKIDRNEEIAFGQAAAARVEAKSRLITSGSEYMRIQRVGKQVAGATGENLPFTFKLIDDPTINAFTFPGGYIYVFKGLIDQGIDDNGLAGVLGHECAHAVKSHTFKILKPLSKLGSIRHIPRVVKDNTVSKIIAIVTVEGVGRQFELEADHYGAGYSYKAGFDPEGLISVFELFERLSSTKPSLMQRITATHPRPEDRIRKLRPYIAQLKAGKG